MKSPHEYIASAIRGLQRGHMADCSHVLRIRDDSSTVTLVSSPRKRDEVPEQGPNEAVRVMALNCDLCGISKGDEAFLDSVPRLVTSVRTDPSGTSCFVGLSDAMADDVEIVIRDASAPGGVRRFSVSLCLVVENGLSDTAGAQVYGERANGAQLTIPVSAWPYDFDPAFGMRVKTGKRTLTVKSAWRDALGLQMACTFDEREVDR